MAEKITITATGETSIDKYVSNEAQTIVLIETEKAIIHDGYHTFDELYDHRVTLYIALCKSLQNHQFKFLEIWRSKRHSDGELCFGTGSQFVLGIGREAGRQITYHIPVERWNECDFATTLDRAHEWDKHTSEDVLERLKDL